MFPAPPQWTEAGTGSGGFVIRSYPDRVVLIADIGRAHRDLRLGHLTIRCTPRPASGQIPFRSAFAQESTTVARAASGAPRGGAPDHPRGDPSTHATMTSRRTASHSPRPFESCAVVMPAVSLPTRKTAARTGKSPLPSHGVLLANDGPVCVNRLARAHRATLSRSRRLPGVGRECARTRERLRPHRNRSRRSGRGR